MTPTTSEPENEDGKDLREMGFINGHPDRNYEEDFEHENGNYISKCRECGLYFRGHKRRIVCKKCFHSPPDWLKLSQKQAPKEIKNNAWPGCWADGEMTGFARCMVKVVQPLQEQLKESNENIKMLKQAMKNGSEMYADLRSDDEPFTPYQIALQQLKQKDQLISELVGRWEEIKRGVLPLDSFESLIKKASNTEKE